MQIQLLLLTLSACFCTAFADQRVLSPAADLELVPESLSLDDRAPTDAIALIMLPGASIHNRRYSSLLRLVQQESVLPVYAFVPFVPADLALGPLAKGAIERAYRQATQKYRIDPGRIVLAGHSLGAVAVQQFLNHSLSTEPIQRFHGSAVFLGASLLRKYNESVLAQSPWLSVVGTTDGLHRPTRVAQGFYHSQVKHGVGKNLNRVVVTVDGMNHIQVAGSERPPKVVRKLDLAPEITDEQAQIQTATLVSAFLSHIFAAPDAIQRREELSLALQETHEFLKPVLSALFMEANTYLKKPCNSDNPSPHCPFYPVWPPQPENRSPSRDTDCWCNTPWADVAVKHMISLPESQYPIVTVDSIHDVRDTKPFHHAHVWSNCTMKQTPCVLNVTTVSESVYDKYDHLDTGFTHSTAAELRVKMKSRQVYRRATIDPQAPYSLDTKIICKEINEKALKWALVNSAPKYRERFLSYGQRMEFIEDYHFPVAIGPLWINSRLRLKEKQLEDGEWVLEVQSISMRTEIDSWINRLHPDSGGQHYCKLLSPARAMEWIYTDGVRRKLGIAAQI